jgi:hypothetical protein
LNPALSALALCLALTACTDGALGDDDDDVSEGEGEGEGEGEEIGPGVVGDVCTFNADCGAGLRCGCDEATGCACEEGARGTGVSGVDTCVDGNDCATSLCVEDSDDTFTCSGPCDDDTDCAERLPVCSDIAFIGRICIRDPDA